MTHRRVFLAGSFILFCACAATSTADADTYIRQVMRTAPLTIGETTMPGTSDTAVSWLSIHHAYQDHGDGTASLYVMADSALYLIDHGNRSIFRVNVRQALSQSIAAGLEEEGEAGPDTSQEEQLARQELNQQMDSLAKAILAVSKFSVEKTGEKKTIGLWETEMYRVDIAMADLSSSSDVWATKAAPQAYRAFQRLNYAQMANSPAFSELMKELDKVEGIAVLTKSKMRIMGIEMTIETEVLELDERTAPDGIYELPEDYELKSSE